DGAPGTTAGSFASYWNVVAFHVYVVPNTTAGGKIDAAMVPLDGTSAARSAVAASRLSASERARPVTSVGWAARSSGRRAAIGLVRGEGGSLPGGRTRYRLERTPDRRDGAVTGRTVPSRGAAERGGAGGAAS